MNLTENIRNIFEHNMNLIGDMDKAVLYFRQQECDKALGLMAYSIDQIKFIIEAIISDGDYFNLVDSESMLEMFNGILKAQKSKDFILLADLLELQLINFLVGVQELIISKEEIIFNEDNYKENIALLMERGIGVTEELVDPINTAALLESGYRVEVTSCGRMTLAAEKQGEKFYFHSNCRVQVEAFLLARRWYGKDIKRYFLYGFGMGYHIRELVAAAPDAEIEIYETDHNVLRLACAFADVKDILTSPQVKIVFDPDLEMLEQRISGLLQNEAFIVHYPSYKNYRNESRKKILQTAFSWCSIIESC